MHDHFDVLIVGSGLAGLSAALHLAPRHRVALLTKERLGAGASGWAQGGIAAVLAAGDSVEQHLQDTLVAGAGLCDAAAVRRVVEGAPAAIAWLQRLGVPFSQEDGVLHLTREGGHGQRRIVHVADATGAAVQQALVAAVRATPGIAVFEDHVLVDLVTRGAGDLRRCGGLQALDTATGTVRTFAAGQVVLATGGAGQVYLHTTSPGCATGDGIACAWRAGCRVANLEFMQFHPTALHHPQARSFLISEAVRGEGGRLLLPDGTRFMPAHDPRAELAPRDIVARAIDHEMQRHGLDCVYLDTSHRSPAFLQAHFPTILARCAALGIDITRQPIPVVPAAHYTCGGVQTDLCGRTDLAGLYAIGETACTGLHGANRLASNSLVECMVFARAAAHAIDAAPARPPAAIASRHGSNAPDAGAGGPLAHHRDALRRCMWHDVGIVRSRPRLARAADRIAQLSAEIDAAHAHRAPSRDLLELRNLVQVADLIVRSAQARRESRGLHYSVDDPATAEIALPTVLAPHDRGAPTAPSGSA
ncbi:L-aspartate oxidase [Xylophilus ampelinus]|uniref:L-aspartate oxidase n=1 Tax=Xylophilus ampelinus TaxID=54067 RepID=A0A318SKD7_9BURK|nr:L-aspartate oxidase [Xylophilus ampelinus]MCS4511054.1 L-aspartate oxidase [Xylophilus ampelinus]PYE75952.1 L-aspartate oxidase [Xylophilus ampelinus]